MGAIRKRVEQEVGYLLRHLHIRHFHSAHGNAGLIHEQRHGCSILNPLLQLLVKKQARAQA